MSRIECDHVKYCVDCDRYQCSNCGCACERNTSDLSIRKRYQCRECGHIKELLINHDALPWVWERCTDECGWDRYRGEVGPNIPAADGGPTGFYKRKYVRVENT